MDKRILNYNYKLCVSFINLKKNKLFILKKKPIIKLKICYYYKKLERYFYKKFFSDYFFLYKKLEMISGKEFIFKKISVWIKNKKKLSKRSYILLNCNFFNYVDYFIDYFVVNNFYSNLNIFKNLKKKYFSLEQFFEKKFKKKIYIEKDFIFFNKIFFFKTLINCEVRKPKKFILKKYAKNYKYIVLNIYVSKVIKIFNFINLMFLNEQKVLLFLYKYFRNKNIKI